MQRPNWRRAYQQMIETHIDEMRKWRNESRDAVIELPSGKRVRCPDLTDDQIYEQARRFAEIDVNRAIQELNHRG